MRLMFLLFLTSVVADAGAALSVKDDRGHLVELPQPAQRVVSLAPHITEILFAIGAGAQVVGVVAHSDYPAAAKSIPQVGGYNSIDLETIVAMKPDLVIAWQIGNNMLQVEKLASLGIPVFINEPRKLEDIPEISRRLAVLTGNVHKADAFVKDFNSRHKQLSEKYRGRKPVSLFYEIWHKPLMTINGKRLISDVIRLCGGRNIFSDATSPAPQVSMESVLVAAPQMIVTGGMGEKHPEWLETWQQWPQIPAVKNKQLYYINPDLIQRHGPRILDGAEILCQQIETARQFYN